MWWVVSAFAGVPVTDLRPVAAAVGVEERYATWRVVQGLPPDALPCEPVWPDAASVCYRVWEAGKRRPVTTSDLVRWGARSTELRAALASGVAAAVARSELVPIAGTTERYLRLVDGDGWAAAGLLAPDRLAERLASTTVRVAAPAESIVIAWRGGDEELDRIMAVGVRELYEATPAPVSPRIHAWDGQHWVAFGEAVATAPASGG